MMSFKSRKKYRIKILIIFLRNIHDITLLFILMFDDEKIFNMWLSMSCISCDAFHVQIDTENDTFLFYDAYLKMIYGGHNWIKM